VTPLQRVAVLALLCCSIAARPNQVHASGRDGNLAALQCPIYGGWILYRTPVGGSGGIEGKYTASHGDCVNFFMQHPDYYFVASVHPNERP